jgi:hypothetical protein
MSNNIGCFLCGSQEAYVRALTVPANTTKFCELLNGKPLFSALYGMYQVTLKELQDVLKEKVQAGQNEQ